MKQKKFLVVMILIASLSTINSTTATDDQDIYCDGADLIFPTDMWVTGVNCHQDGQVTDSEIIDVPVEGRHNVYGVVHRGNPGQCQTNEDFYLEVNSEFGPETEDDLDPCAQTIREDYLGEFYFDPGENEVIMHTASICPPDVHPNSVDIRDICVYYGEEIPEFSALTGGIATILSIGLILLFRKRK